MKVMPLSTTWRSCGWFESSRSKYGRVLFKFNHFFQVQCKPSLYPLTIFSIQERGGPVVPNTSSKPNGLSPSKICFIEWKSTPTAEAKHPILSEIIDCTFQHINVCTTCMNLSHVLIIYSLYRIMYFFQLDC